MYYKVEAVFYPHLLQEFYKKLSDGTIKNQKPDGEEIIASLKKAVLKDKFTIEFYEKCFCAIPLKHERETVYDKYMSSIKIIPIDEQAKPLEGKSFWKYMEAL